ncbi:hypothetical protein H4R33_006068 [Dimargaris cristalligena]|nr:hypothetical protein H4R33_006068 [Dimargaris cristalligena]
MNGSNPQPPPGGPRRSSRSGRLLDITPIPTNQTTSSTASNLQATSPRSSVGTDRSLSTRSSASSLHSEGSSPDRTADGSRRRFGFKLPFFSRKLNFSLDLKKSNADSTDSARSGRSVNRSQSHQPQSSTHKQYYPSSTTRFPNGTHKSSKHRNRSKSRQRTRAASVTYLDCADLDAIDPLTPHELRAMLTQNAAAWTGSELRDPVLANTTFNSPTNIVLSSVPAIRISSVHSASPPLTDPSTGSSPSVEGIAFKSGLTPGFAHPSSHTHPSVIRRLDFNQVPSANPVEDRYSRTHVTDDKGQIRWHIIGIYDGHSGHQTAEYIARWLPERIATALRTAFYPQSKKQSDGPTPLNSSLSHCSNPQSTSGKGPAPAPSLGSINSDPTQPDIIELLKQAFIDMDREIVHDALHLFVDEPETVRPILFPAITGSCAVVALIDETTKELYVAHCGDSRAILGVQKTAQVVPDDPSISPRLTTGSPAAISTQMAAVVLPTKPKAHDSPWAWKGIQLTSDHNAAIELERVRLSRDHQDGMSVVVGDRVLGLLAVTRAFGDASFKWHRHLVQAIYPGLFPDKKCPDPMASISPPYITARPDVMRLKLRPQDRFLVLASDGLFEGLSNELVAELMGGFFEQIVCPNPNEQTIPNLPIFGAPVGTTGLISDPLQDTASSLDKSSITSPDPQSSEFSTIAISPTITDSAGSEGPTHYSQANSAGTLSPHMVPGSAGPSVPGSPRAVSSNGGDPDDKFNFIMDDPTFTPTEERRLYLDAGLEHGLRKGAPIYQEGQENEQRINAATLLIENTFNIISKGATPSLLALKAPDSSNYRDDVTVAVIFF